MVRISRSGANGPPASRRSASRLALLAYGVAMALIAATGMVWITFHRRLPGAQPFDDWLTLLSYCLTSATLGVVLARRRPEHPIGWLFLALGCISALQLLSGEIVATITLGWLMSSGHRVLVGRRGSDQ